METEQRSITFEESISAPVSDIFLAFTNATKFKYWLCQMAVVNAVENGRLYLAWENGYYAVGSYISVVPNEKIVISWQGKSEPYPTSVTIEIVPGSTKNILRLTHSGFSNAQVWEKHITEIDKGWRISLPNLVSILETGIDLRISQRPLIGIYPELYTRQGEADPFPLQVGMKIIDVIEGYSAGNAGLKKGDILVDIEGTPITSWASIPATLTQYKAGDLIQITFYRGAKRIVTKATLSSQQIPLLPTSIKHFADDTSHKFNEVFDLLMQHIRAISDNEASHKISLDEWSIKEIIAHLIHSERDNQLWIHSMVQNCELIIDREPENLLARVQATVSLYPNLTQLLEVFHSSLKETVALLANLPQEVINDKSTMWRLAMAITQTPLHIRSHFDQIEDNLENARKK